MALTSHEQARLLHHVNLKWRVHHCQLCGSNNWVTHGVLHLPLAESNRWAALAVGGPTLPTAAMICQECGNTVLINLMIAGVVVAPGTVQGGGA